MVEWIYENRSWIFSGVGAAILGLILRKAKGKAEFELTFRFYALLFTATIAAFGFDYLFNYSEDWRLRVFIFGTVIIATFVAHTCISHLRRRYAKARIINRLSIDDCAYVIKCYEEDVYFRFESLGDGIGFDSKWEGVLLVPRGRYVELYSSYKIVACRYAYKLAKRKLRGMSRGK
ncbi:MAG: hypothetical protein FWC77_05075 [Defluviitaleaceae bacterium]|nr:hypothetical protein [Defluviitaleaceae bacterium]